MPRNIEIKVRLSDLAVARATAAALGARYVATEEQVDRYYGLDAGRRDEGRCRAQIDAITRALDLHEADFIRASYADLLQSAHGDTMVRV